MTGRAKQNFKEAFAAMADRELQDMADSIVQLEMDSTGGTASKEQPSCVTPTAAL